MDLIYTAINRRGGMVGGFEIAMDEKSEWAWWTDGDKCAMDRPGIDHSEKLQF